MQELKVNVTPAIVSGNFEDLKNVLAVEVKKYDIEVAEETVKDAKKLATELNGVAKIINEVKKKELLILEAPVKDFKDKIKELIDIVQDGRGKITSQVKVFEDNKKVVIERLLLDLIDTTYSDLGVKDDFKSVLCDDLILLGNLTPSGNLTAKTIDVIELRVRMCGDLQNAVKMRLMQLENESYKAGLKVPLSVEYIKDFMKEPDEVYKQRLAELIEIELKRQADSVARSEAEAERLIQQANRQREQAEQRERDAVIQAEQNEARLKAELLAEQNKPTEAPQSENKPNVIDDAPEGKKTLRMAISFDVIVRSGADNAKASAKIEEMLKNAGLVGVLSAMGIQNFNVTAEG